MIDARRRAPWYLLLPAGLTAAGVTLPLAYLLVRGFDADAATLGRMLFRTHNLRLLVQTLLLSVGVLAGSSLIGLGITWLSMRARVPLARWWAMLAVLPLAVPPYLMAYALRGLGGDYGLSARLLGVRLPPIEGLWGAWLALTIYATPIMVLNLRAGLAAVDRTLEEAARSLGEHPAGVFWRVLLPQLKPAWLAGALIVVLNVVGDFGVVSLMRYETFSYALYQQYAVGERVYAAWIAMALLVLTLGVLAADAWLLRGLVLQRRAQTPSRPRRAELGGWRFVAVGMMALWLGVSLVTPLVSFAYWATRSREPFFSRDWFEAVGASLSASAAAAVVAVLLAMPLAWLGRRYRSRLGPVVERLSYLGFATPCLAFALGLIFFSLRLDAATGWTRVYQSFGLLVYAYALHYLAEAVGPLRARLFVATPRLEEAGRSLGAGALGTLHRVTWPVVRGGVAVSVALVFLSSMKELPLTILLAPIGFDTLATVTFSYAQEAMFAQAGPMALTIVAFSALLVGLVLLRGEVAP